MATKYADKLQSPKWQQKRLSILERDKWTCQMCSDTDTTLHIHHHFYLKDYEPWDYKDEDLITYCKHCHAAIEAIKTSTQIHETISILKFPLPHAKQTNLYAIVTDLQNQMYCLAMEYLEDENRLCNVCISAPMHMISRINFEMEQIKLQRNG